MKQTLIASLCISALTLFAGCGGESEAGKTGAPGATGTDKPAGTKDIDLGKLGSDEMKSQAQELVSSLATKLEGIKDEAGAIDVKKAVEPILQQLSTMKTSLAGKMPDLSSLTKAVEALKTKFKDNEAVMKVIQPVLDQISKLVG